VKRDDITAEKTSFRANEKLLSALSRKSPQHFQLFLDALDNCGQRHVRNNITAPQGLLNKKLLSLDFDELIRSTRDRFNTVFILST